MRRTTPLGIVVRIALCATLVAVAFQGCDSGGDPSDVPEDESTYVPCEEDLCVAGSSVCCPGAEPGTWDSMRLGCICPSSPDADADGDGDDGADVEPDTGDVEPDTGDVDPDAGDVEPDVDPDAGDVEPDVDPDADDVEPDVEPDAAAEAE